MSSGARKTDTGVSRGSAPRSLCTRRFAHAAGSRGTLGESSTRNQTRLPARFPTSARVRARACVQAGVTRASRADRNPTDVQHVYVSQATLTSQFMRALTGPQPFHLFGSRPLRRRLARLTQPRIYQRGSTYKFTHRRRAEYLRSLVATISPGALPKPAFVDPTRYLYFRRSLLIVSARVARDRLTIRSLIKFGETSQACRWKWNDAAERRVFTRVLLHVREDRNGHVGIYGCGQV